MITQKQIKELLHYNPETGIFTWLERTSNMFRDTEKRSKEHTCKLWNANFSGKVAGSLNSKGAIKIQIGKHYLAHILAYIYMTGKNPDKDIDHCNGNPSDNCWSNLRLATVTQNNANSKIRRDNTSGFKGVSFQKKAKKWEARIQVNKKKIFLGLFNSAEEAHKAYCESAEKYFGKFARTA